MSGKCANGLATILSRFSPFTNGHNSSYYPSYEDAKCTASRTRLKLPKTFWRCALGKYDESSYFGCLLSASLSETMSPVIGRNRCQCSRKLLKTSLPRLPKNSAPHGGGQLSHGRGIIPRRPWHIRTLYQPCRVHRRAHLQSNG